MSEISNPYRPGEPVAAPAMLFGRQDAVDWLELQLTSDAQTIVFSAQPRIGKTSFIKHVGSLQTVAALDLIVALAQLPLSGKKLEAEGETEQTLNSVLEAVIEQLGPQLERLRLIDSPVRPRTPQMASALRDLFGRAAQNLPAEQRLVLYIDDLPRLMTSDLALVASFLTSLMPLLDENPRLHLVFVIDQDQLKRLRHPLIDGAAIFSLGVLPFDASINMITQPVKGILRFDYGVTKRIAEVNSHHPYYLTLYCHTLLNRQVHDGWVNQQDFDSTLTEILETPIEPFTDIWDQSSWPERAVLAGMAAIQGAHGPITSQEVIRFLQRQSSAVIPDVVMDSLRTLSRRGVLIPMGAVSYRFHVELLRFWLREHTEPAEVIAQVNWGRAAAQVKAAAEEAKQLVTRPLPGQRTARAQSGSARRRWLWPLAVAAVIGCVLLAAGSVFAAQFLGAPLAFLSPPSPTPTPTATAAADQVAPLGDATPAAPEATTPAVPPTPTPALVVARTLPSIVYMGRDVDEEWRIYMMNADGSDSTPLPMEGEGTGPVWSPDGQKIAFVSRRDGNREVYVMDADGQNLANVTRHPADDWTPAWSPDSSQLAFSSFRDGSWEIFVLDAACLSEPSTCPDRTIQITINGNGNLSPVWSPDGTRFAYNSKANDNWDIYTMASDGTDIRQVTTAPENDLAPAWSPDGSQLAFESNREGNVEIYVIGASGGVARNITNLPLADDHGPTWSPDGSQIVFYSNREGNWDIFVTTLDGEAVFNLTSTPTRDEQTPFWRP